VKYELRGGHHIERKEFDRRIKTAEKYIFSLGPSDPSEEIGRINATLYLAKIHYAQEKLGCEPRAMFIGAPDFTFQTSPHKFYASVPEGGKIIWGDRRHDFIPGDMEFDFCGMLVGTAENVSSLEEIIDAIHEIKEKEEEFKIDGKDVDLRNFSPGSHFLNIYKVQNYEASDLPGRIAILHTSSNKMRDLLIDFVRERGDEIPTPFGKLHVLLDADAREYAKKCEYASNFSKKEERASLHENF
jgi:hypothetical protein